MEKFIPYEKLSKKEKRALDAARRGSWGGLSPVTRRPENPKAYKRKKARIEEELDRAFVLQACAAYGKVWERTREGRISHEAALCAL